MRADRRTLLLGAGALTLTLAACSREVKSAETDLDADMAADGAALDLDLSDLEARHGGRLGLAVASAGVNAAWRGDERFVYCSTFKMYLAAATLLRVQAGQERLDRAIPITAADMIKLAMIRVRRALADAGLRSKLLLQVHDELVFDMVVDEEAALTGLVTEAMVHALPLDGVPVVVETGKGRTWLEAH